MAGSRDRGGGEVEGFDCLVVGAGIAGLLAAVELGGAGLRVVVIEKGRGLGGRMATRRRDGAVFDHGAQFFTARDGRFCNWVERWQRAGFVERWYEFTGSGIHFRGVPGMTAIAKHLVAEHGLDVRRGVEIEAVRRSGARWVVSSRAEEHFSAAALLLTAPVPQSLALLDAGGVTLAPGDRERLGAIRYRRCIAAMAILERQSALEQYGGALKLRGEPVQWIADNQRKGVSPDVPSVTIHSTPAFAERHWDVADEVRLPKLLAAAAPHLAARVVSCEGHRWGFSAPVGSFGREAFADAGLRLALAGDGLTGGRVEGAALSGLAAAGEVAAWFARHTEN